MDLFACTETIRRKMGSDSGLGAVLKFDCGEDGVIVADGRSVPNSVANEDRPADCTIALSLEHLVALLEGRLNPVTAFMTGKVRVSGDMTLALKLQRVV